jgi:hypothetical protein
MSYVVRQLCEELSEQGRTMGRVSTTQVVEACRLDASHQEIEEALHVVGEQYEGEADALELYFWECAAGRGINWRDAS